MRPYRWTVLAAALLALAACSEALKPGRCDQTSDCVSMSSYGAGYVCNLDLTPQGNGRCVPKCMTTSECTDGRVCDFDPNNVGRCLFPTTDGGVDGMDGMDGGDGGPDTRTCPVCSGNMPVCVDFTCVECAASSDCSADPTKPICDTATHTCGPCTTDSQCADKLGPNPGVCMAHQDGRCATDAETVYVQNTTTGCDDAGGGTAAAPFCSMTPVQATIGNSDTRTLVLVRGSVNGATVPFNRSPTRKEASIVGQQSAVIGGGAAQPGVDVRNGLFYARDIKVAPSATIGISAVPGAGAAVTLRLEHVTVDSCQGGGILLDGAGFDIRNTTVMRSGPGTFMGFPWGGILVNNPPGAPKHIELSTVRTNDGGGISCAGSTSVDGVNVLVSDNVNTPAQIGTSCGFASCGAASSTCGAQ
jgi:hypothetical protein